MTDTSHSIAAASGNPPRPPRRPRYSGKNPRKYHEKYKELNPQRYPETIFKVEAGGKTAAGTHRPICAGEILEILNPQAGSKGVDATLGYGGHAAQILERLSPEGFLLGLDTDSIQLPRTEARLRTLGFGSGIFEAIRTNYASIDRLILTRWPEGVDFILADLGCSSMQLDDPARGFSFKTHGPLDMRMNPAKGPSAAQWLGAVKQDRLAAILRDYGDLAEADEIAEVLCQNRKIAPLETTTDLKQLLWRAFPGFNKGLRNSKDPAMETALRKVFQAIRIAVNDEFSALEMFLRAAPACLKPSGRLVILTFHSGEDRRVKTAFKQGLISGLYGSISDEVVRPSAEEIQSNPRASSAKLRWAIRGSKPVIPQPVNEPA